MHPLHVIDIHNTATYVQPRTSPVVFRPCAADAPGAVSCSLDDLVASKGQDAVVPPPLTASDIEAVLAHSQPSIKAQHMALLETFRMQMETTEKGNQIDTPPGDPPGGTPP